MYGNITEFGRYMGNALTNSNVDYFSSVGWEITFLTPALIRSNAVYMNCTRFQFPKYLLFSSRVSYGHC